MSVSLNTHIVLYFIMFTHCWQHFVVLDNVNCKSFNCSLLCKIKYCLEKLATLFLCQLYFQTSGVHSQRCDGFFCDCTQCYANWRYEWSFEAWVLILPWPIRFFYTTIFPSIMNNNWELLHLRRSCVLIFLHSSAKCRCI